MIDFSFPTTAAEFIAFQEAGIHRKLNENERMIAELAVEVFNMSYTQGRGGHQIAENTVDRCIAQGVFSPPKSTGCRRFVEAVVYWNNLAYRQGRRDAERGERL